MSAAVLSRPEKAILPSGKAFRHIVMELHNPQSGRLEAQRIAVYFGIPLARIAALLGRPLATVHKTPDAIALQEPLGVFERVASLLLYLGGTPETSRIWVNAPHPDLGQRPPLNLLLAGQGEIVAELLEDAVFGQPG